MKDLQIFLGSRQYGKTYKQRQQIKSYIKLNYIPRKRIENKIKELEKEKKKELVGTKGQDRYSIKQEYNTKIEILKEILAEDLIFINKGNEEENYAKQVKEEDK